MNKKIILMISVVVNVSCSDYSDKARSYVQNQNQEHKSMTKAIRDISGLRERTAETIEKAQSILKERDYLKKINNRLKVGCVLSPILGAGVYAMISNKRVIDSIKNMQPTKAAARSIKYLSNTAKIKYKDLKEWFFKSNNHKNL